MFKQEVSNGLFFQRVKSLVCIAVPSGAIEAQLIVNYMADSDHENTEKSDTRDVQQHTGMLYRSFLMIAA